MPDPNAVTAAPQESLVNKRRKRYKQVNRKAGSARKGQRYRTVVKNGDVTHVYADGTVVGKGVGKGTKPPKKHKGKNAGSRNAGAGSSGFDPLAPITGRQFNRELRANTRLQFGDETRQLQSERRISDQAQANIPAWFAGYQAQIAQARGQATGYAQAAQQAAYNQANQAALQGGQQVQQQQAQGQQQANKLGVNFNAQPYADAGQAVAARQGAQTQFGTAIGAQGVAQNNYLADRGRVAAGQGVQAQLDELGRRRNIEQEAKDLARKKGDFKYKFRGDVRASERQWAGEQEVFGLNALKEKNDAAQAAAELKRKKKADANLAADRAHDNSIADQTLALSQRKQTWVENHPSIGVHGGSRADGGYTTSEKHVANRYYRNALGQRGQVGKKYTDGKLKGQTIRASDVIQGLVDKGYDRLIARAAIAPGRLSSHELKLLRRMGIHVPRGGYSGDSATPRNKNGTPG